MAEVTLTDDRSGMDALQKELTKLRRGYVDVGLFGDQGSDLVKYAATNEFGATIKHPGGTDYGYRNDADRKAGRVRFVSKKANFRKIMYLGTTGAHSIVIPERPFIRGTFDDNTNKRRIADLQTKLADDVLQRERSAKQALTLLGVAAESLVRAKIVAGPWTPNARSTIRAKGSSKPLINTARMRNSITSRVGGIS